MTHKTLMSKFWELPVLKNSHDHSDHERPVSWLELFSDLAFVVAIASIAHEFGKSTTTEGLLMFVALFIPVWWAWLGDAFYTNRFDPEDHGHQVLTLVQMMGIVGLAVFAHNGLHEGFTGFALSYILVRSILAILSYRIGKNNPKVKRLNYLLANSILAGLVFWVAAIVFSEARFWLVGIGLA